MTSEMYLIYSNKTSAWYRPCSKGYTSDICQAGLFTRAEAERMIAVSSGQLLMYLAENKKRDLPCQKRITALEKQLAEAYHKNDDLQLIIDARIEEEER